MTLLQNVLEPAGFTCHRLVFTEAGTPDVDNLYARLGTGRPHLCFAGHTDVVPVGNAAAGNFRRSAAKCITAFCTAAAPSI